MIKTTRHVKVKDLGWGRVMRQIKDLDNVFTKVGLPEEGEVDSGGDRGIAESKAVTKMSELALIGIVNEFGVESRSQPPRPWLRASYDVNLSELKKIRNRLYDRVVSGNLDAKQALGLLGEWLANKTKKYVRDLKEPPNAPSTIARKTKGGQKGNISNPLIDFAQMINSIQHVEIRK